MCLTQAQTNITRLVRVKLISNSFIFKLRFLKLNYGKFVKLKFNLLLKLELKMNLIMMYGNEPVAANYRRFDSILVSKIRKKGPMFTTEGRFIKILENRFMRHLKTEFEM